MKWQRIRGFYPMVVEKETEPEEKIVEEEVEEKSDRKIERKQAPKAIPSPYRSPVPYPQCVLKAKQDEQYGKFLNLFKQLHINLWFVNALMKRPKYAKFPKGNFSKQRKLEDVSSVALNEECYTILLDKDKLP